MKTAQPVASHAARVAPGTLLFATDGVLWAFGRVIANNTMMTGTMLFSIIEIVDRENESGESFWHPKKTVEVAAKDLHFVQSLESAISLANSWNTTHTLPPRRQAQYAASWAYFHALYRDNEAPEAANAAAMLAGAI